MPYEQFKSKIQTFFNDKTNLQDTDTSLIEIQKLALLNNFEKLSNVLNQHKLPYTTIEKIIEDFLELSLHDM